MQLSFTFSNSIDVYDARNFIVHDGNRDIFDFITSTYFINNNVYLLTGPSKSGKTYICNIWNKFKGATFINSNIFDLCIDNFIKELNKLILPEKKYILEDLEKINPKEEYLLYFLNFFAEKNALLLITSNKYVKEFEFFLPDLKSRFYNIFNFVLRDLNDDSKGQIILKLLTDKQLNIDSDTLNFITRKISGSYDVIFDFVDNLERFLQLNKIKRIGIKNVRDIMNEK